MVATKKISKNKHERKQGTKRYVLKKLIQKMDSTSIKSQKLNCQKKTAVNLQDLRFNN